MFYYFNGEVTLLESNLAVIDCSGVGYACRTSSYTLSRLHVGERARLYTYCSIREDAFDIYGFSTREELRNFELLLGVPFCHLPRRTALRLPSSRRMRRP